MPTFAETATADCAAIYETLKSLEAANPGVDFTAHHAALAQGLADLLAEHPEVKSPLDGGDPKP